MSAPEGYDRMREKEQQAIEDYLNGKIQLEERANRLTLAYAEYCEKAYEFYYKYPQFINTEYVYTENFKNRILLKTILIIPNIYESQLESYFKLHNIIYSSIHNADNYTFFEFRNSRKRTKLDDNLNCLKQDMRYTANNSINPKDFKYLIEGTSFGNIFGEINYQLIPQFERLPHELYISINNGNRIERHAHHRLSEENGIRPDFAEDLGFVFRSGWESCIARVLEYKNIKWTYEETHLVLGSATNKVVIYNPDFFLDNNDIIEVKGFWDKSSLEKIYLSKHKKFIYPSNIKNYNKRFLSSKLYIIDEDMLFTLNKIYSPIIPKWNLQIGHCKSQPIFVVGINRPERIEFVKLLNIKEEVFLLRDIENEYDRFAIKVVNGKGNLIGYVSKEWASLYSEKLDMGMKFKAIVKKIDTTFITINVKRINLDEDILYDFLKPNQNPI